MHECGYEHEFNSTVIEFHSLQIANLDLYVEQKCRWRWAEVLNAVLYK